MYSLLCPIRTWRDQLLIKLPIHSYSASTSHIAALRFVCISIIQFFSWMAFYPRKNHLKIQSNWWAFHFKIQGNFYAPDKKKWIINQSKHHHRLFYYENGIFYSIPGTKNILQKCILIINVNEQFGGKFASLPKDKHQISVSNARLTTFLSNV